MRWPQLTTGARGTSKTGRAQTELFERAGISDARTIDSWLLAMGGDGIREASVISRHVVRFSGLFGAQKFL